MNSIRIVADYCRQNLLLEDAKLSESYFYKSLTFCVIDAVFSIRAKYETTMATVERYCKYFGLDKIREDSNVLPAISEQQPVRDLVQEMKLTGAEYFADYIFQNRQRTSSRSGILKSEAVMRFATVLETFGVNYLQDVEKIITDDAFEVAIREIPGQGTGIVLNYFFMLAGTDDLIKPDTHVMNFLTDAHRGDGVGQRLSLQNAQTVLSEACKILKSEYAHLTPRLLDNAIWSFQRKQNTRRRHGNYKKEKAKVPRIDLVQNKPVHQHLWDEVVKIRAGCASSPIHGLSHWKAVYRNGCFLAQKTGANADLVEFFALFHDSCRLNDHSDPDHGKRAAEWIASRRSDFPYLQEDLFKDLIDAIRHHTDVQHTKNVQVATCWDADRLDLGRVGITPEEEFMNTEIGRAMVRKGFKRRYSMIPFKEVYSLLRKYGPATVTSSRNTRYSVEARLIKDVPAIIGCPRSGRVAIHEDCWGDDLTCQQTRAGGLYNGPYSIFDWYRETCAKHGIKAVM